jgi:hypothetical protein
MKGSKYLFQSSICCVAVSEFWSQLSCIWSTSCYASHQEDSQLTAQTVLLQTVHNNRYHYGEKIKIHISVFWQVNIINVIQFTHSEPPTLRYKPRRCVAIFAYLQGETVRPITKQQVYWLKCNSVLQVAYDIREMG